MPHACGLAAACAAACRTSVRCRMPRQHALQHARSSPYPSMPAAACGAACMRTGEQRGAAALRLLNGRQRRLRVVHLLPLHACHPGRLSTGRARRQARPVGREGRKRGGTFERRRQAARRRRGARRPRGQRCPAARASCACQRVQRAHPASWAGRKGWSQSRGLLTFSVGIAAGVSGSFRHCCTTANVEGQRRGAR